MKRRTVCAAMIGALGLGTSVYPAAGYPIAFEFAGEIDDVFDPNDFLGRAVTLGSPFSGLYTFESDTPDISPDEPTHGRYNGALISLFGQVGVLGFLLPDGHFNVISVQNDDDGLDSYVVRAEVEVLGETGVLRLTLVDGDVGIFCDDSLPLSPPDLGFLDTARFNTYSESDTFPFSAGGNLTLLTPEPRALALLGIGALIAGTQRRKRSTEGDLPTRG